MPVTINDTVVMTDDGKFTSDFKPEMLGEEYKGNKYLTEKTPDLIALLKSAADSKSALGKKLEHVIQKPGENATDQERAEYETELKEELGAGKATEDYIFEDNGVEHAEDFIKMLQQMFLDEGTSPAVANRLVAKLDAHYLEGQTTIAAATEQQFQDDVKAYKADHLGNKLITGPRTALKAMLQFANDVQSDLNKEIIDKKVIADPNNFELLRSIGIGIAQLRIWEPIGEAMKSDLAITNEGKPSGLVDVKPKEGTQEAVVHKVYDHETSKADRAARGKSY